MTDMFAPARGPKRSSLAPPGWLWLPPSLLFPLAVSGPNFALGLYAVTVLAFGLRLLWRPGEPPILLFIFLWQWMQSATGALYGNAIGVSLAVLHPYTGRHEFASGLMLTGVLVLALCMRATAGPPQLDIHTRIKTFLLAPPFTYWVRIYTITWVFSAICEVIAPMAGGLRLPFLTMATVKWASFLLLTMAAFTSPNPFAKTVWGWIFGIEFILSIGGFFSGFKEVFFFALFGLAAANIRLDRRILFTAALMATAVVGLALVWTAIKVEYRAVLNGGTGQQVELLDYGERIAELGRLVSRVDSAALGNATDHLASRVMYHVFFGVAAERVPAVLPHTYGEIWIEAIARPLMPRLLFPNKREIHDSDLTNRFTGLDLATKEQGASISLGYMAEAYIDFGVPFMFFAIGVLGVALGAFYRWLLHQRGSLALAGVSLAPVALMPAYLAETSILKMVSSLVLMLLVSVVVIKILAPTLLRRPSAAHPQGHP